MIRINRTYILIIAGLVAVFSGLGIYFLSHKEHQKPILPAIAVIHPTVIFIHGTANGTRGGTPELANWFAGVKAYISKDTKLVPVAELDDAYVARKLVKALIQHNPKRYKLDRSYAFSWNGALSNKERKKAAHKLFQFITQNEISHIEFYTHSHGGNVLLHLANIIEQAQAPITIEKAVLFACPVQDETINFLEAACVKKVIPLFSTNDKIQILDPQHLWSDVAKTFFSRKRFARSLKRKGKLREAEIRINGQGPQHGDFLKSPFIDHLSEILDFLATSDEIEHIINIDTKHSTLVHLTEQVITP